jgi:hypothetical protein
MNCRYAKAVLALFAVALVCGSTPAADREKGKVVELALCLDVSGSMDGLIGSAKARLWDVVNELARAKPTPDLRVALYSYGSNAYDEKAGWVRQELELTGDLDRVSEKLFALKTATPNSKEYVGRVCRAALDGLKWSDGPDVLKVVFVCGNEEATQDHEVALKDVAASATKKGVSINTVYCGSALATEAASWKDFATLAGGHFAAIDQDRGTASIATPVDKELAELSVKLNETFCFVGKGGEALAENQRKQDDNAAKLGGGAAASRAESKAGALYRFEGQDLVDRLRRDSKFDVKKVAVEELPDRLKKMTPEEREKHVRGLLAKREELEKGIAELSKKREIYLREQRDARAKAADKALDEALRDALREQAKRKGIEIPK